MPVYRCALFASPAAAHPAVWPRYTADTPADAARAHLREHDEDRPLRHVLYSDRLVHVLTPDGVRHDITIRAALAYTTTED